MTQRLITLTLLVLCVSVTASAESVTGVTIISIGGAVLTFLTTLMVAIIRFRNGKATLLSAINNSLKAGMNQSQVDAAVEVALQAAGVSPKLADVIGDVASSIALVNLDGTNLSIRQFITAVIGKLTTYSPDILKKMFVGTIDEIVSISDKKEAFLNMLEKSKPLVDAAHEALHSME